MSRIGGAPGESADHFRDAARLSLLLGQAATDHAPSSFQSGSSARRSPSFNFLIASGGFDAILRASSVAADNKLFMWHNAGDEPNLHRSIGIDDVAGE
jgi:hypothetical protein